MYSVALFLHSWNRWIALIAVVGTVLAAFRRKEAVAERWGSIAMMSLDLQMLIGLLLYFVISPNMREILANFGASMKEPAARFWAVEHITPMIGAIAAAHVGRVLARKAKSADQRRLRLLVCFGVAFVLIMVGMPWPGRPGGRELFRGLGL